MSSTKGKIKEIDLVEIVAKNPHIDRAVVDSAIEAMKQLQALGMTRPDSISAQPPTDPYSSCGPKAYRPVP